ncbi:MAG: hypothetical protein ACTSRU_17045, partial [Candidatus Hodarchaeales archaeon]
SVIVLSSGEYDKFGSFILDNTSEQKEMVGALPPLARIGTAWNLTVSVGGNSTSGVNITFHEHFAHVIDWWEGVKMFTVSPNQTRSEIYVSHAVADFPIEPMFYCSLVESTGYASGDYQLLLIHGGYPFDVGTGETSVSNITAWLEELSSTNNKITSISWEVVVVALFSSLITIRFHHRKYGSFKRIIHLIGKVVL